MFGNANSELNRSEGTEQVGLDFIPGRVKILEKKPNKLPHLGWNSVNFEKEDKLLRDIENNKDFYFIHSYYFECEDKKNIIGRTNYNQIFASIVKKQCLWSSIPS